MMRSFSFQYFESGWCFQLETMGKQTFYN